jgi:hypothetical protein
MAPRPLHIPETEIINEGVGRLASHVPADMCKFMQKAEPKIVEPVVTQRETNDRRAAFELQGRAVEMCLWKMLKADEMDAVLGEKLSSQLRAFLRPA